MSSRSSYNNNKIILRNQKNTNSPINDREIEVESTIVPLPLLTLPTSSAAMISGGHSQSSISDINQVTIDVNTCSEKKNLSQKLSSASFSGLFTKGNHFWRFRKPHFRPRSDRNDSYYSAPSPIQSSHRSQSEYSIESFMGRFSSYKSTISFDGGSISRNSNQMSYNRLKQFRNTTKKLILTSTIFLVLHFPR